MQELEKRGHVTEEMWVALKEDTISQNDFMKILEHTCDCTWCAEKMAQVMEPDNDAFSMPPSYLKQEILERSRQLDVQTSVTIKQTSKKIQLLLYSLKVGMAVTVSVLILGATANFQNLSFTQMETPKQEVTQEKDSVLKKINQAVYGATEKMEEFTEQLLNGGKKR